VSESPINYEKLISYAAGDLAGPDAAEVEAWLARDPAAAETVARYRMVHMSIRQDECPSSEAVARARALFDRARPARPGFAEHLATLVARLIFDSRAEPALAGLRGRGTSFQLTYDLSADGNPEDGEDNAELDLQAEPAPQARSWRVVGQVAGCGEDQALRVDLCRAGSPTAIQTVQGDRRGTFVLSVEPGAYDLHLHLPGRVAVVPDIRMT